MSLALSIQETCEAVGLGPTKLYSLINSGELKASKIGKRTVVLRKDLEEFLDNLESYPSK